MDCKPPSIGFLREVKIMAKIYIYAIVVIKDAKEILIYKQLIGEENMYFLEQKMNLYLMKLILKKY
jgi:hypothetical protein